MANHHPSPPMQRQMHHGPPGPARPPPPPQSLAAARQTLMQLNEEVWINLGAVSELFGSPDDAMIAYQHALRANPNSIPALNAMSLVLRNREDFPKAAEYLNAILKLDDRNGEAWGSLGHCYLMMDDLQQAYNAYQSALSTLPDPKEPRLWYGIGILYDRYGSLELAEDAFAQVMQMQPDFDKAHEIYFRLGIIYKQQQKYSRSLECFKYIVNSPPTPLTEEDIWFQIGHVHEQQKDFESAKAAYHRVLERDPNHAKVLQQLGWLHHTQSQNYASQERAIDYLEKSVAADNSDAQSWYLLGRCYMQMQKYPKAYEAYQQAVYRDGRNPTFWCSIGVLYYQINQYRDALDAYSRAIRLNPYISEVWYDLGTLYESCNNQIADALDAYQRAAELDPTNPHIKTRLQLLRNGQANGAPPGQAPMPTDVNPHAYQAAGTVGPPGPQWAGSGPPPQSQPPQAMLNGNGPGPGPNGWGGRISDINPPPQPPNPYATEREPFRGQPPPGQRQPSPQPEQRMRPYPEANRLPEQHRRGPSPPPQAHYTAPPPPPPPQQSQQPPQVSQPPPRVRNPNYGGHTPAPVMQPGSAPGPSGNASNPLMPYRTSSPRNDGRPPMHDNRMPSPKSAYPQHQPPYPTHPDQAGPSGPESGVPLPPQPGMHADAALHREHDGRPPSVGPKRMREWEDDRDAKKPTTEEARARMDDIRHRRPSTPPRLEPYRRNSSEIRRFDDRRMEDPRRLEEQRRAEEMRRVDEHRHGGDGYHPSEAAHHPPSHSMPTHLPPMQQGPAPLQGSMHEGPGPQAGPVPKEYQSGPDERRMDHSAGHAAIMGEPERAARKVEFDEDYDDSGEEDKKAGVVSGPASGPSSASEMKNATPTSAGINGIMGQKVDGN
ncbi:TPR-like protein [Canariomyces notabilis]|uniref:TPR-like protein n=1 Tax=Canariomyces notabilis TaxID=2074819 RepID=A0AAN6TJM7_9PEZI|nr:TPR-like protein [Canariomyces arenarius]